MARTKQISWNLRFEPQQLSNFRLLHKLQHEKRKDGVSFNQFMNIVLSEWWDKKGHGELRKIIGVEAAKIAESGEKIHIQGEGKIGEMVSKEEFL